VPVKHLPKIPRFDTSPAFFGNTDTRVVARISAWTSLCSFRSQYFTVLTTRPGSSGLLISDAAHRERGWFVGEGGHAFVEATGTLRGVMGHDHLPNQLISYNI